MSTSCLWCKYLNFDCGSGGYSEYTPGWDASIYCIKSHWKIELYNDTTEAFREKLLTALSCNDFSLISVDWIEKLQEGTTNV